MKKGILALSAITLLFAVISLNSCKKEKSAEVYFTSSEVSLDAANNATGSVNVELSEAVGKVVELWIESVGPDTLQFGSFNERFLTEDSFRVVGALGVEADIDSPIVDGVAHIKLPIGTKSFKLSFKAEYDNFEKRAVQYQIKIVRAENASVRSGSDVLTCNVAASEMVPVFASEIMVGGTTYKALSSAFKKNAQNKYDFTLSYGQNTGDQIAYKVEYLNFTPVVGLNTSVACNDFGLRVTHGTEVYSCADANASGTLKTHFTNATPPNHLRGNYQVMLTDTTSNIVWDAGPYHASGNLNCKFVVFQ